VHEVVFEVVNREGLVLDVNGEVAQPIQLDGVITPPEPWETGFKDTVIAYRAIMRSDYAYTMIGEFIDGLGDLICDIMHLCDLCDLPFEDVMDRAMMHYDEEKAEEDEYKTQRDLPVHD